MNLCLNIQKNLEAFLSIAIEHSLDLYIEQAVDKPTPHDKDRDIPTDHINSSQSKKKSTFLEKSYDEFDNYLSRSKGCLGQIDSLLKLAVTCSKNDVFASNSGAQHGVDLHRLHFINALDDIREINNSKFKKTTP